ncbi:hypothetical protein [Flavobacterium sp.]|uniref:hypothetical protein n=1 Tax=Flavobacterium sp. TaxID=239 RepID=UPI00286B25A8|nr:hypothetical protein [Flavobacterium sp.]
MNDPIVESLNYILKTSDEISFDNPPILEEEFTSFKLRLENGSLNVEIKNNCATEDQARSFVDPYLKAWELDYFLTFGRKEFWFEFINSKIVDRNPTIVEGSNTVRVNISASIISFSGLSATVHVTRNKYPLPPKKIKYSPDVESLIKRVEGFQNGKEPLLSMAYFCLTIIESSAGSRTKAVEKYSIRRDVLNKLGDLTSERGDKSEARKVKNRLFFEPLTMPEQNWIIETIKLLIRRKAEYDFDPDATFQEITMGELPAI